MTVEFVPAPRTAASPFETEDRHFLFVSRGAGASDRDRLAIIQELRVHPESAA